MKKKNNISQRRRVSIYYHRFILLLKLSLLAFLIIFFLTDFLKSFKNNIRSFFYNYWAQYGFVLENVIVGDHKNIKIEDIISALEADKGTAIFAIDIAGVKNRLKNHLWVHDAIVERRLPATIHIDVIERTPIAIWQFKQKLYLIDSEGNRISKHNGDGFDDLPHVVGQDANIYAQNLLDDLNRYPNLAAKVKSAVRYGQRRWNLNLEQNIIVKMPEEDFGKAYDYLYSLDKNKKLFDQNYKILDFRDAYKYYVKKDDIF